MSLSGDETGVSSTSMVGIASVGCAISLALELERGVCYIQSQFGSVRQLCSYHNSHTVDSLVDF